MHRSWQLFIRKLGAPLRAESPEVLGVEAGKIPKKGVQSEDEWNSVQSDLQVPGGAGGPQGRREGERSPSGLRDAEFPQSSVSSGPMGCTQPWGYPSPPGTGARGTPRSAPPMRTPQV